MYTYTKNALNITKELASGGEGVVHLLENGELFKEYRKNGNIEKEKLTMLSKVQEGYVAAPKALVVEGNRVVGYTMDRVDGIEIKKVIGFGPKLFEKRAGDYRRLDLLRVALDFVEKLEKLHNMGILVGDINENNIMLDISERRVNFIDCDSYQIDKYPCPVGTPDFTAPEIQGTDFRTRLRTKENELFSAAVMIFTILMPGQKPYASKGGEDVITNIKNGNFPYPLGLAESYEYKEPAGRWDIIWRTFSPELKKAFYTTFKEGNRVSLAKWKGVIKTSMENLDINDVFPNPDEKIDEDRSNNLNSRWTGQGNMRNIILKNQRKGENKIAVLELSTKAVKLLIRNNLDNIEYFSYDDFGPKNGGYRDADKTETGNGLDKDNNMNMRYFEKRVVPSIRKFLKTAVEDHQVKYLYCVATAAIRTAKNRSEILGYLKKNLNLNCGILSKKDEAIITAKGFKYSGGAKSNGREILKDQDKKKIAFIDQGGGSTEFIVFDRGLDNDPAAIKSLNLGTTALKNSLYINSLNNTPLESAFKEVDIEVGKKVKTLFREVRVDTLDACIGVGTAITNATGKNGNRNQHCYKLTIGRMVNMVRSIRGDLIENYSTVGNLKRALENTMNKRERDNLDNKVVMAIGLNAYINILKRYQLDSLIVNGTGLWYGTFYQAYEDIVINREHRAG